MDSTNTWVKENYKNFDYAHVTRVSAEEQFKGRGRFANRWLSPKGNIYLTYFFVVLKNRVAKIHNIPQIFSLSIVRLLCKQNFKVEIKWPNDLLIDKKKFAGILCETIDLSDKWGIILGGGINVNMEQKMVDMIDQPATSLYIERGVKFSITALIKDLELFFLNDLHIYIKKGFSPFHKRYEKFLAYKGEAITLEQNGHVIFGKVHSIHQDGCLNLFLPSGKVVTISAGAIINKKL